MSSEKTSWVFAIACALLLAASCASHPVEPMGGETHWLRECGQADQCGDEGLQCICGVCTRACAGDDACTGTAPASCYDQGSPLLLQRCEGATEHTAGICLPDCSHDDDCRSAQACVQGACVPKLTPAPDVGSIDASTASSSLDFDDLAEVQPKISWTEPVDRPELATTIAGGDEQIAGVWKEIDCDRNENSAEGCFRLELSIDGAGVMTGTLYRDDGTPARPLPAVDPSIGYPSDYPTAPGQFAGTSNDLLNYSWFLRPGYPYRVLDGKLTDGTLTFVWSHFDLWRDWCAAQTPQRWLVGDHAFYFCAPQDRAAQAALDQTKVALCTTASFGPICDGPFGPTSCDCLDVENPRCSISVCHCDSEHCEADVREAGRQASLVVEGDTMKGFSNDWPVSEFVYFRHTFERVKP